MAECHCQFAAATAPKKESGPCLVKRRRKAKCPTDSTIGRLLWRRLIDSFAPAYSPFGLPVYLTRSHGSILFGLRPWSSGRRRKSKAPMINSSGLLFWRRPTLARPIAVLPSGLQRFTSVFGMGTGGATALLSPEINPETFRG